MPPSKPQLFADLIDKALQRVSDTPDGKSALEQKAFDSKEEFEKAQIRSLVQDIEERKAYALRIFVLICAWIGGLFLLLMVEGLSYWIHFYLSEPIVLAAIGSTTVDVLGLFYIVTRYLFHSAAHDRPKLIVTKRSKAKASRNKLSNQGEP